MLIRTAMMAVAVTAIFSCAGPAFAAESGSATGNGTSTLSGPAGKASSGSMAKPGMKSGKMAGMKSGKMAKPGMKSGAMTSGTSGGAMTKGTTGENGNGTSTLGGPAGKSTGAK